MDFKINKLLIPLLALGITACTSIPKDGGITPIASLIDGKLKTEFQLPNPDGKKQFTPQQVEQMIGAPLSLIDAERLSIAINPITRVKLAQVGIAEADYAQAGRMENPGFSYARFSGQDYDASLLFDIGGVILMPLRRQLEARRLESARYQAAGAVLQQIAATRVAWINAVAEKQQTVLMTHALESVQTGNNLTRQMAALGHSNIIEAADSELLLGEMRTSLSKQRLQELAAKESLIRQLGLWGEQARQLQLPDQLPKIPITTLEFSSVEQHAIENRLDVQMANMNLEGMAKNLKLTRLNPFLSAIELGPTLEKGDGEIDRGFELEFRIPIFDSGGIKTEKARIVFRQAEAQAEVIAIIAASNARQALAMYRNQIDIARHYRDVALPLRQRISEEQLLMYNGMLISVFDLLEDMRGATQMKSSYVNALRDFWLADTNLQQALTGSGTQSMNFEGSAMMPSSASASGGH